jgi:uncharacterized damage-inducible protein DinB
MALVPVPLSGAYDSYFDRYISRVKDGNVLSILKRQLHDIPDLLAPLSGERGNYSYAEGKWSIKDVLLHIIDTERIFSVRALRIARGDQTAIPGFDHEPYVETAAADNRSLMSIIQEFITVRDSTRSLFNSFPDPIWSNTGMVDDQSIVLSAIPHIIAGHYDHHVEVLLDRYKEAFTPSSP